MNDWFEEEARSLAMRRDDPKGYEELGRRLEERNRRYYAFISRRLEAPTDSSIENAVRNYDKK